MRLGIQIAVVPPHCLWSACVGASAGERNGNIRLLESQPDDLDKESEWAIQIILTVRTLFFLDSFRPTGFFGHVALFASHFHPSLSLSLSLSLSHFLFTVLCGTWETDRVVVIIGITVLFVSIDEMRSYLQVIGWSLPRCRSQWRYQTVRYGSLASQWTGHRLSLKLACCQLHIFF